MTTKTFKRYENKYLLREDQYQSVIDSLSTYMNADEHEENGDCYTICNIYYDTENNDIIKNSLSKPYYKEKLRLRSYGSPTSPKDKVFLELKKKIGGIVSKRRASMPLSVACEFLETGIRPKVKGYLNTQVIEEIEQFLTTYKVAPKAFISYDRVAFFGKEDKDFRLTFDSNIKSRRNDVTLENKATDKLLFEETKYLMEVKIIGAIPIWLASLLSQEKIYSTSFSKYGTEYKKYCAEDRYKIFTMDYVPAYLPASFRVGVSS